MNTPVPAQEQLGLCLFVCLFVCLFYVRASGTASAALIKFGGIDADGAGWWR